MAINYYNIRTKETRVADSEPLIYALYNSSNLGVNSNQGQDFGWRLAAEVVVEMNRIFSDPVQITAIASTLNKPYDEINKTDVLFYISNKTSREAAPVVHPGDYDETEYLAEIKRLQQFDKEPKQAENEPIISKKEK